MVTNQYGQPVGPSLADWTPPPIPQHAALQGRFVKLIPSLPEHATSLALAFSGAAGSLWTYLPYGPLETPAEFETVAAHFAANGWHSYAVVVESNPSVVGFICHLRIDPGAGSIEVGAVTFAPTLQRTPASTEAQYLLMRHAFESGFRRYEWKCDDLNEPSRAAAERLGFTYEGTFRNATHYKGRSRDTAWYSIVDTEWPRVGAGFEQWLKPDNFGHDGAQVRTLRSLMS